MTNQQIVFLFLSYLLTSTVIASTIKQKTEGWCSPAINDTKGNIIINCHGLSPKVEKQLNELLDIKNTDLVKAKAEIDHWLKKHNELKTDLTKRSETDVLAVRANKLLEEGDLSGAEELLKKSLSRNLDKIDQFSEAAARDAYDLGSIKELQLAYREAIEYYEQAVRLQPNNSLYLNEAGLLLQKLANYHKAIKYFEQVLTNDLKTYDEDHPDVAQARNLLGMVWLSLGKSEKAINYFEQSLASNLNTFGEDHPNVATIRNILGSAWDSLGEHKKAIDYYEQSLASNLNTFGEDHPDVARDRNNLGGAWHSLGEHKKAIRYLEQALVSDLNTFGEDHPNVATIRNNLGSAWDSLGEHKKAISNYEKALPTLKKFLGKDHPNTKILQNNLDYARAALND